MDVSEKELGGQELIEQLVALSGLPRIGVEAELRRILEKSGHDPKKLTMDQLRTAMMEYLCTIEGDLFQEPAIKQ